MDCLGTVGGVIDADPSDLGSKPSFSEVRKKTINSNWLQFFWSNKSLESGRVTRSQSYEWFTSLYLPRFYLYSQVLVNTSILGSFFTCIYKSKRLVSTSESVQVIRINHEIFW